MDEMWLKAGVGVALGYVAIKESMSLARAVVEKRSARNGNSVSVIRIHDEQWREFNTHFKECHDTLKSVERLEHKKNE